MLLTAYIEGTCWLASSPDSIQHNYAAIMVDYGGDYAPPHCGNYARPARCAQCNATRQAAFKCVKIKINWIEVKCRIQYALLSCT